METLRNYIQKIKNIFKKYPNLLLIYGLLFGICITCFLGNTFKSNTVTNTQKVSKNNKISNNKIDNDSIERVVDSVNESINITYDYSSIDDNDYVTEEYIESNNNEDEVLKYFNDTYNTVNSSSKNDKNKIDKIKSKINTISDFLFNGGVINGYTYNELSDEVKLNVNKLTLNINNKIDEKFPDYKNKIKSSFNDLKGKVTISYLNTVDNICNSDRQYLCDEAKKDFNKMKDSFKLTYFVIKDLITTGKTNILKYFE